ncbi:MAG: 4Fe-4S binding protein [Eubacteriales bacterium]|nr:4Fe-4S binding protein [Eubacteriales bacterium]
MKAAVSKLVWKLLGRKELTINEEKCMRCYHCKENCPKQAIE